MADISEFVRTTQKMETGQEAVDVLHTFLLLYVANAKSIGMSFEHARAWLDGSWEDVDITHGQDDRLLSAESPSKGVH